MTHEPDAQELVPDPAAEFFMDQRVRVTDAARALFPDGTLIDLPHDQVQERLRATQVALARGDPAIFEATFSEDGIVVVIDILALEDRSYTLIEVESSTSINDHHLLDAAFKAYVLRRVGIEVDAVEIMHLNEECRSPDLSELFVREAISGRVRHLFSQVSQLITDQNTMLAGTLPAVEVGKHCNEPRECPFKTRCWPVLPLHHVETFYGLRQERSAELGAQGLVLVEDVPETFPLTVIQQRQQRSVTQGELQVDGDLGVALAPLDGRVAFLAFEAVGLAVPVWEGLGPWHPHPVQFSCHIASPEEDLRQVEWLAEGSDDPRPGMARALVETLEHVDVVVVYDKAFEKECLDLIAAGAPDYAKAVEAMKSKLHDLLPVVRNHVYHRDFLGSFSRTAVSSALVPDLRRESPEVFQEQTTETLLNRLLFSGEPMEPAEREVVRRSLLANCAFESLALVRLTERLDDLAKTPD
ncbi:MAG: DUF2779 domain-containing protein [Gemmatimonadetes bacterium]|nr:DUF2779 domain-containing protein [Gemmatimonadota bacterium]